VEFRFPYVPDFRVVDLVLFLVPGRGDPREAYHSLPQKAMDRWSDYLTRKGERFLRDMEAEPPASRGPFRVRPEGVRLEILEGGRLRSPRPCVVLPNGPAVPILSLEKKRPFDPWKPTYIKSLHFIKKYKPVRPIPRAVEYAILEAEESGEIPGSVSWENAQLILSRYAAEDADVRAVLVDVFERRPETFPLASRVYLDVLARSGSEGLAQVCALHGHPQHTKRCHVARALADAGEPETVDVLLKLLDDENGDVLRAAVKAVGKAGMAPDHPAADRIRSFTASPDIALKVWAMEAFVRAGDENEQRALVQLVKDSPLPLIDMGELGEILIDLGLVQTVPYLIKRLKSDRPEVRADAAETLAGLTGLDAGLAGPDDAEERRSAIRKWERWWDEHKRGRSRDRASRA
jgi:hypothetical protein